MRQLRTIIGVAGVVAACGTMLAVGGAFASARADSTQTLRFLSVAERFMAVPAITKAAPPQVGTRFIFQGVLYNRAPQFGKPSNARIGRTEGICTLLSIPRTRNSAAKPAAQCVITAHVPSGQIVSEAEGDPGAKVSRYAITGGIGAYGNASGTVTATAINQDKTLVVVHLGS